MVLGNASDGANTDHGLPDLNHIDNANMSTPPDGMAPTMQMYLFGKVPAFGLAGIPSANGGDDAEVVYHEYTHGLSNRLVIYPDGNSGLDNQQAGSMGEAWSDWYAEDFLNQQGYKPDTGAVGDVVMGELTFNSLLRTQPRRLPRRHDATPRAPAASTPDPAATPTATSARSPRSTASPARRRCTRTVRSGPRPSGTSARPCPTRRRGGW